MYRTLPLRPTILASALAGAALLTGCSGFTGTALPDAATLTPPTGAVHGGQQPIVGARVYLYAMSTTGYKTASTNLLPNNGFVTTDSKGSFSFVGLGVTCPAGNPQLYFLSVGGNPGQAAGTDNAAIQFLAPLGPCSGVTGSASVTINEVSTVAAATALQAFVLDGTHIGTSSGNLLGLTNAVRVYGNLLNPGSGLALARTPPANGGNGLVPQAEIHTLADILAPCANSTGPGTSGCSALFQYTASGDVAPNNTLAAALNIARAPGAQVANLFSLVTPAAPFQPTLAAAPNDFSIALTYTGNNLVQPGVLVLDAAGNLWTASCRSCATPGAADAIAKFGPTGNFVAQYTAPGIHSTQGIAFDLNGNLWTVNAATTTAPDQITQMLPTGVVTATYSGPDLVAPLDVAIDPANNAWVSSSANSNLLKFNQSVAEAAGSPYTPAATGISAPAGLAFDNAGNLFVASAATSSILKLNPSAALPTGEPIGGYQANVLSVPSSISVDFSQNVWTYNVGTNSVGEIANNGTPLGRYLTNATLFQTILISFDGSNTAWLPNCRAGCPGSGSSLPDTILRLDPAGNLIDPSDGLQTPSFQGVGSTAVDASGNLWVANSFGGTLTQLVGVATPVLTPLAAATFAPIPR